MKKAFELIEHSDFPHTYPRHEMVMSVSEALRFAKAFAEHVLDEAMKNREHFFVCHPYKEYDKNLSDENLITLSTILSLKQQIDISEPLENIKLD